MGAVLWPALLLVPRSSSRWALTHQMARAAFWLMGIRLDVTGTWPKTTGVVIVSNHASYLDGLVLAAVIPGEPAFIAKKELEPQFFAGPFLRQLGALFVDRADPEGGVEDVNKALDAAQAARMLVFLPEGTFTRAPGLLPSRLGAFVIAARQHLSILPLTLRGTRSILRSDQWFPRRGAVSVTIGPLFCPTAPILMLRSGFAIRCAQNSRQLRRARRGGSVKAAPEEDPPSPSRPPCVSQYPRTVDWLLDIPVRPVDALLDEAVAAFAARPFLDFFGRRQTYAQTARLIAKAALGFRRLGVRKGTKVGLLLPNSPYSVICFFCDPQGRRHGGEL